MSIPRVLIADDQADILQALRLLLGDAGFGADLVSSADDVMAKLSTQPYDLLLMDLNYSRDTTSGREGLDLLDRVRTHDRTLPVVVMTGWGSIETAVEAMRRGARSFVQKPWDDTTLVEVVSREVDDGRAARRRDAQRAREQEDARLIQRALLPATLPRISGLSLAARWTPAGDIGGDCYDVLQHSGSVIAVSIADVIGKGLPAALLMSNLQAAVRAFGTAGATPHHVCTNVNRLLCQNIAVGKFVTFCYLVLDRAAGTLTYANAGHNPLLLVRADGAVERLMPTGGVLGVFSDWTYSSGTTPLRTGDRLVCFTDGITEALAPDGTEFGDERLVQLARAARPADAASLLQHLIDHIRAWTQGPAQDDATLIVAAID